MKARIEIADLTGHDLSFFVITDTGRESRIVTVEDHECDSPEFEWEGPTKWDTEIEDGEIIDAPDSVRCTKCRGKFMVG